MSYATDLAAIARQLAVIGVHGSADLSDRDLDVALTARAGVLELAMVVQRDLTRPAGRSSAAEGSRLEAHPVAGLADALQRHPRVPAEAAPSDLLMGEADSDVGRAWQLIGRHAISAQHHWNTGSLRATGPQAWAGLADMAAVGSVIAELDADLAASARSLPGRERAAVGLAGGVTSGLRVAARLVAELAATGPLSEGPELLPAGNRGLVTITSAGDVPTALEQFATLLRTAGHVRPERLALMVVGHLRTCQAALDAMPSAPQDPVRLRLQHHVEALRETTRHPVTAASVRAGDTRSLRQMQVIRQALASTPSQLLADLTADSAQAARLVAGLADGTRALRETADRHIVDGHWLLPDRGSVDMRWQPARTWHEAPRHLQALRFAAVQAEHLAASTSRTAAEPRKSLWPRRTPALARNLLQPAPHQPMAPGRLGGRPPFPSVPASHARRQRGGGQ
jgi:hypothetical protein